MVVDGTFKLCKATFTQLLTINAFVWSEEHPKQIPLVFVLMSGKKKKDYRAVVKEILRLLPNQPSEKKITVDLERAMWSTMGYTFHWTQALWRKVTVVIRKCWGFSLLKGCMYKRPGLEEACTEEPPWNSTQVSSNPNNPQKRI